MTLIDCKRQDFSSSRKWIDWQRRLGKVIPLIRRDKIMKILQIMGGYLDGGAEIFYIDALIALKNVNEEQYAIVNKKNKKGISKLKRT